MSYLAFIHTHISKEHRTFDRAFPFVNAVIEMCGLLMIVLAVAMRGEQEELKCRLDHRATLDGREFKIGEKYYVRDSCACGDTCGDSDSLTGHQC